MIEKLLLVASENYNVKAVFNNEKEISEKKINICILTSVMLIPGKRLNDS